MKILISVAATALLLGSSASAQGISAGNLNVNSASATPGHQNGTWDSTGAAVTAGQGGGAAVNPGKNLGGGSATSVATPDSSATNAANPHGQVVVGVIEGKNNNIQAGVVASNVGAANSSTTKVVSVSTPR